MMHHMSTTKPRITVTLEEATAMQLRRMSELTGNSQSSMISELLEQAQPVFSRVIAVLEAAQKAKDKFSKASVEGLELAQERLEKQLGIVMGELNEATEPILEAAKSSRGKVRGGAGGARTRAHASAKTAGKTTAQKAVSTPLSNRGVRSAQTQSKVIAQNDGSVRLSRVSTSKKQPKK